MKFKLLFWITMKDNMKTHCISVHGVGHEMKLCQSDLVGFYVYKLIPIELGYEPKFMYIATDGTDHWMYGKPMEGKQIELSQIQYFYTY